MDVYPSVTELIKTRPLISVFLVGCATHIIYTLAKKYLEYRVSIIELFRNYNTRCA